MNKLCLLLITPPFTQLNTPYPATPYLAGFLQSKGYQLFQADLSIETFLALFSRQGLTRIFNTIREKESGSSTEFVQWAMALEARYLETIDPVIRFLQGKDSSLATRICRGGFLPEGTRFANLEEDDWAFGSMGLTDRAKHLASLYIDDLSDLIQTTIDPRFGLSRYAEQLASSATSFDPVWAELQTPPGLIDHLLEERLGAVLERNMPDLVGITVPFPGNLYGALRAASFIRKQLPGTKIILGGGYVNTELRELAEPRIFDLVDYVTLDGGEAPLLSILESLHSSGTNFPLCRTFLRQSGKVVWQNDSPLQEIPFSQTGTPSYQGLPLQNYLSIVEMLNPMHRLWSDGRWNKLTVAHGCYWKKCAFCDIGLDYIERYEPAQAALLADRIDALITETGETGFHFVDEAAPPARLADLALELLERGRVISWWGNIRFEESFTPDLCRLLAASGCIAVTGGLETASDRLLDLMEKGISVAQAARVCDSFTRAGIMVHAYLMYGFPSETDLETIESLERVRQFFEAGLLQSAFWHRFTATRHSPVGLNPGSYGIKITGPPKGTFANNDLTFSDPAGSDPEKFGPGLSKAVYNYMHGNAFDRDVRSFFDFSLKKPEVPKTLVRSALRKDPPARRESRPDRDRRLIWLGGNPLIKPPGKSKGKRMVSLFLPGYETTSSIKVAPKLAEWLQSILIASIPRSRGGKPFLRISDAATRYPVSAGQSFKTFQKSGEWKILCDSGLLMI